MFSFVFNIAAFSTSGKVHLWQAFFNPLMVILNAVVLSLFALFIIIGDKFREKGARLTAGVYSTFIVALFMEMFGLNLSLFLFSWAFGNVLVDNLYNILAVFTSYPFFANLFFYVILPVSNMLILTGILLVIYGWSKIYKAKGQQLVTTGIYKYIRHPQYLGFMLITFGMIVLWPVLTTVILWPLLFILYRRLAKAEEKRLEKTFGENYIRYKNSVPRFIPKIRSK
jgi:methanethiol S-methyltransferase